MSISEVARRAGVSPGTVSRVINNRPGISDETAQLVRETIADIGYIPRPVNRRPGPRPKADRGIRTGAIGLLAFVQYKSQLDSPVYAQVVHGAEAELAANGLMMVLHRVISTQPPPFITNGQVDGLLLFSGLGPLPEGLGRAAQRFPAVSMMGPERWCDQVTYDNSVIGGLAAEHLLSRGHEALAMLGDEQGSAGSRLGEFSRTVRAAGKVLHRATQRNFGLIDEEVNGLHFECVEAAVEELIALSPRPTAIFAPADMYAAPLYGALTARGIVPGRDIEVVTVNNEGPLLGGLRPRPATIDIKAYQIGQMAVRRLLRRLEEPDHERMTVVLDPVLVSSEEL